MKITEGNIEAAVDYIIIAVVIVVVALLMVSVGNAVTDHLPTII